MKWKIPPPVKVYEALTAIGNGSVAFVSKNHATVRSSIGTHKYNVYFDLSKKAVISDDSGSRWQGYLGYPSIAVLMLLGVLSYEEKYAKALAGVKWAILNKKFKRDYARSIEEAEKVVAGRGISATELKTFCQKVLSDIRKVGFSKLGSYGREGEIVL